MYTESALIPKSTSGQKEDFRSGTGGWTEGWKFTRGGDHRTATAGIEPLLPWAAFSAAARERGQRTVVGQVDESAGGEFDV
jgi:hypothetical protein